MWYLYAFENTPEGGTQPLQDSTQRPAGYCVYRTVYDEDDNLIDCEDEQDFDTYQEAYDHVVAVSGDWFETYNLPEILT